MAARPGYAGLNAGTVGVVGRYHTKAVFLTYAGLSTNELTLDAIVRAIGMFVHGEVVEYSAGLEKHANPANAQHDEHIHVYFKSSCAIDTVRASYFDVTSPVTGRVLRPYIQSVGRSERDRIQVVAYTQRDGHYVCSPGLGNMQRPVNPHNYSEDDEWGNLLNAAQTVDEGMELLATYHPRQYYMHGARVEAMLIRKLGLPSPARYTAAQFRTRLLSLARPVVLSGPSGSRKTAYALAHGEHPLLVRCRDQLKALTPRTDLIVFDDMNFSDMSPEEAIHLLDMEYHTPVHCRYADAYIPAFMPRIFLTNKPPADIFPRARNAQQQRAIDRRYVALTVAGVIL